MNHSSPVVPATSSVPVQSTADADTQLASLRQSVLACAEPMIALSTEHLHPDNRQRLIDGALSVVTYPNEYGGFVHVGPEDEGKGPPGRRGDAGGRGPSSLAVGLELMNVHGLRPGCQGPSRSIWSGWS